jgi:hypothetical protein
MRKKNRIHRKAWRSNSSSDWNKFRRIRNDVTYLVRRSKEEHKNNLIKKLINENSSGSNWWKTVKQLTGIKSHDHGIPPLVKNDNIIFDDIEKAIEFNIFFAAQSNIDDYNGTPPNEIQSLIQNLEYIVLNEKEVEDVLKIINPSDPDLINPRLLKEASSILKNSLCKLFNMSLQQPIFPSQWKRANVSPVFKNNKPNEVKNYRPISLLSVISKCMERCVYKHVYNNLLQNDILTRNQSGFTKGC